MDLVSKISLDHSKSIKPSPWVENLIEEVRFEVFFCCSNSYECRDVAPAPRASSTLF